MVQVRSPTLPGLTTTYIGQQFLVGNPIPPGELTRVTFTLIDAPQPTGSTDVRLTFWTHQVDATLAAGVSELVVATALVSPTITSPTLEVLSDSGMATTGQHLSCAIDYTPTETLFVTGPELTTLERVKTTMDINTTLYDAELTTAIQAASSGIENYCDRRLGAQAGLIEVREPSGLTANLYLDQWPTRNIVIDERAYYGDTETTLVLDTDYRVLPNPNVSGNNRRLMRIGGPWPPGILTITYDCGYATTIPQDLAEAATQQAVYLARLSTTITAQVRIGRDNISTDVGTVETLTKPGAQGVDRYSGLLPEVMAAVEPYRRALA